MTYGWRTDVPGVLSLHSDECPVRNGMDCRCGPLGYRGSTPGGPTYDEGRHVATGRIELGVIVEEYLRAVEDGLANDRYGRPHTLASLRTLRAGLGHVHAELGTIPIQDVRRSDLRNLLGQLRAAGVDAGRVDAVADGLHELFSYAVRNDVVELSPAVELGEAVAASPPWPSWSSDTGQPRLVGPDPHPAAGLVTGIGFGPGYGTGAHPSFPSMPRPADAGTGMFQTPPPADAGSGLFQAPLPAGAGAFQAPLPAGAATGAFQTPGETEASLQERWMWWTVRLIVLVFVLIALVLVAESV
jgi:hypothetical protein